MLVKALARVERERERGSCICCSEKAVTFMHHHPYPPPELNYIPYPTTIDTTKYQESFHLTRPIVLITIVTGMAFQLLFLLRSVE